METEFECPICGSQKYQPLEKMILMNHQSRVSFVPLNVCAGCGIVFADPEKFAQVAARHLAAYADETFV